LVCLTFDGVHFVQQPELHLHPALQSALADVFIDAMRTSQSQTIIETHSEHLLLRLLRRIRRTEQRKEGGFQLLPENVAVYYFDPQVNGESIVTRQFITPLGDFYNDWPRGFFADRDQDLIDGRI
jgi:predicted ATPase